MRKLIAGLAAVSLLATSPAALAQRAPAAQPAAPAAAPAAPAEPDMFTLDQLKPLVARTGSRCQVEKDKQIRKTATQIYYELACTGGYGEVAAMILPVDDRSNISIYSCVDAPGYHCELTPAETTQAWMTQQLASLSQTLAAKGFECQANKMANHPTTRSGTKSTEVGCANRPDSAVVLEVGTVSEVVHCARAMAEGVFCSISEPATWAAAANTDLHAARPQSTCTVADADLLGQSASGAYLEVTCTDGLLGNLINYPRPGSTRAIEVIPCALATNIGGGCQMETNVKARATATVSPAR